MIIPGGYTLTLKAVMKVLPYIAVIGVLIYLYFWIHGNGFDAGAASVQKEWDKDKTHNVLFIAGLKAEYDQREADHRATNTRITHELSEANNKYDLALAKLRSDYNQRLQSSSKRADIYQRQAEGGAAECRSLAEYASRLDQSLEEGRSLVQEFGVTLRLRDEQVKELGNQILNDRKLFSE